MKRKIDWVAVAAMALFAMLLCGLLGLAAAGGTLYERLVRGGNAQDEQRAALSYVAQQLGAADAAAAVRIEAGPQGDMLVLAEPAETPEATGYETRIYQYNGSLMEEYRAAGAPCSPETAQAVASTVRFAVTLREDGLVRVTTDEGEALVYLHSLSKKSLLAKTSAYFPPCVGKMRGNTQSIPCAFRQTVHSVGGAA